MMWMVDWKTQEQQQQQQHQEQFSFRSSALCFSWHLGAPSHVASLIHGAHIYMKEKKGNIDMPNYLNHSQDKDWNTSISIHLHLGAAKRMLH
jgi:hypothetical protein